MGSVALKGLLVLLALVALPLGSASPLWQWFWGLYIFVLGGAWLADPKFRTLGNIWNDRVLRVGLLAFCALILIGIVQIISSLVLLGAPSAESFTALLWDWPQIVPISVNPGQSVLTLSKLVAHGILFLIVLQRVDCPVQAQTLYRWISIISIGYAVYGLIEFWSGNDDVLWFSQGYSRVGLTSSFINSNNYATFASAGLLCCWSLLPQGLSSIKPRRDIKEQFNVSVLNGLFFFISGVVVLFTALILTGSRGGMIAFVAALIAFVSQFSLRQKRHVVATGTLLLGLLLIVNFSGGYLVDRFAEGFLENPRIKLNHLGLEMLSDRPVFGYGLGTFPNIYSYFRSEDLPEFYLRAHNEYLEVSLSVGVVGLVLVLITMCSLIGRLLTIPNRLRPDKWRIATGISACTLFAVHSLVDFPLQITANSTFFVIILAASMSGLFGRARE